MLAVRASIANAGARTWLGASGLRGMRATTAAAWMGVDGGDRVPPVILSRWMEGSSFTRLAATSGAWRRLAASCCQRRGGRGAAAWGLRGGWSGGSCGAVATGASAAAVPDGVASAAASRLRFRAAWRIARGRCTASTLRAQESGFRGVSWVEMHFVLEGPACSTRQLMCAPTAFAPHSLPCPPRRPVAVSPVARGADHLHL
jgi:hypothetical protein